MLSMFCGGSISFERWGLNKKNPIVIYTYLASSHFICDGEETVPDILFFFFKRLVKYV